MKTLLRVIAAGLYLVFWLSPVVFGGSASTGVFNISTDVSGSIQMQVGLNQNSSTGPAISNMNFGILNNNLGTGSLRSTADGGTGTASAVALVSATSSGVPYTITQTGTAPTSGTDVIPAGACTVVPVYSSADNGGAALVGSLGVPGSWVATNKVLYTSDAAGSVRVIQCHYAVTDDPASGATASVPLNQPPGNYTSTVTFTVTS